MNIYKRATGSYGKARKSLPKLSAEILPAKMEFLIYYLYSLILTAIEFWAVYIITDFNQKLDSWIESLEQKCIQERNMPNIDIKHEYERSYLFKMGKMTVGMILLKKS